MRQHNKYHRNLKRIMEEMVQTDPGTSVKKRRKGSSSSIQKSNLISSTSEHNLFPDLISDLPDSLLLHILSLLDMYEVMKTSLLSRRWRYLWKSIPCLLFLDNAKLDINHLIDRCLFHHEGSKIRELVVRLDYEKDKHALLVDSCIHFAMRRKVEDVMLLLDMHVHYLGVPSYYDKFYNLPSSLYLCTELTTLSLYKCNLNLPDSFQLGSLKKLYLDLIELKPDSIERLSSSCPILEDIRLTDCNSEMDLNIVIKNEQVKRLVVSGYKAEASGNVLKINAPTLLSLKIYGWDPRVRLNIEELGSLMNAYLGDYEWWYIPTAEVMDLIQTRNSLEKFLYGLRHVKHLKLSSTCGEVLSIKKPQSSNKFFISATYLELQATLEKQKLPAISYLLQICPNLLKFKIVIEDYDEETDEIECTDEFIEKQDFEEKEYWESTDITSIMQKLKIIEIDVEGHSRPAEFVRFLLKNAKVLETLVIKTPKQGYGKYNLEQLFKFSQRLHAFPRSSPNAKLFIT